ncbi:hypothetical protein [Paenibacillus sp. 481]|uniref:hypothetical protein n=1 Tax=Paenibacillus sp. 481 TaxID=2835869 RepID=UPI001E528A1A|nr:hypothetical protein [Paenibacillus sp. 481]UHA75608.1 hypothetical protein KIK04_11805 [Paenibacillus sp. 481]
MLKIQKMILLLLAILILVACKDSKPTEYSNTSTYDLYVNHGGDLGLSQISKKGSSLEATDPQLVNFRHDGSILSSLEITQDKHVYASFYDRVGGKPDRRVKILKDGTEVKELTFDEKGPHEMISDQEKGKIYVVFAFYVNTGKSKGIPLKIINTKTKEVERTLYIKGGLMHWGIAGDYIYSFVMKAHDLGYGDVPDRYIIAIHRDTGETKIISNVDYASKGMAIGADGNIYAIHMSINNLREEYNNSELTVYSPTGNQIAQYKLGIGVRDIVIDDDNGLAYIAHNDKYSYDDRKGDSITVFDTKSKKVIQTLKGFSCPTELQIVDDYLFVLNEATSSVKILDKRTYKVVNEVKFDETFLSSMNVLKRK